MAIHLDLVCALSWTFQETGFCSYKCLGNCYYLYRHLGIHVLMRVLIIHYYSGCKFQSRSRNKSFQLTWPITHHEKNKKVNSQKELSWTGLRLKFCSHKLFLFFLNDVTKKPFLKQLVNITKHQICPVIPISYWMEFKVSVNPCTAWNLIIWKIIPAPWHTVTAEISEMQREVLAGSSLIGVLDLVTCSPL